MSVIASTAAPAPPPGRQRPYGSVASGVALLLAVGLFTAMPTFYLLVGGFNVAGHGELFRLGLDNWREIAGDPSIERAVGYSFLMSLRAPLGVAIAFVIAWLLVRVEVPGRRFIEYGLWFAFFLPTLPLTIGWILLLDPNYGLLNDFVQRIGLASGPVFSAYSVANIMWVHLSLTIIPINVILLSPAIAQMDAAFEEAATMSGAGRLKTMMRITLPLMAPALLTCTILGFIKALEAFEVEQVLGVPVKINVFATKIYDFVHWDPPRLGEGMALSSLLLVILLAATLLYRWAMKSGEGYATVTGKTNRLRPATRPRWAWIASVAIFTYMAIGVVLPIVVLTLGTFTRLFGFFFMPNAWTTRHWVAVLSDSHFVAAFGNSFLVAGATAIIGAALYTLLAWVLARGSLWGRHWLNLLVWLPWGVPGILLGLSMLVFILHLPGFALLHGTVGSLVLVMLVKEIPLGVQMLKTAIVQIARELEEAASMSGASFVLTIRRIVLPLIAPMMGSVLLLAFVAAFRDVSTTILLSGPNSRTMAILMIELGEEGRFEAMAVVGVILSLVVLAMTFFMRQLQSRAAVHA
jgi:iron(III) transport system permease protein